MDMEESELNAVIILRKYEDGKLLSLTTLGKNNNDGISLQCPIDKAEFKFFEIDKSDNKISSIEVLVCRGMWFTNF